MSIFVGTYKMESSENLQKFYETAGVPWVTSKILLLSKPTLSVSMEKDDTDSEGATADVQEVWVIKTVTFLITREQSFKFGEPYEETMPNGDVCECVAEKLGEDKIILKNVGEDHKEFVRELQFSKDGITEIMKMDDVEAKRIFKRVE